jgi:protein-disulfide isomerase
MIQSTAARLAPALLMLLVACSGAAQPSKASNTQVVATAGGASITLAEVDERAMRQSAANFGSMKLSQAIYEARRAILEDLIGDKLLDQEAKARGIETAKLVEQEIGGNVAPVTDADIAAWYQANPQRVQGATLEQVRAPIRSVLLRERTSSAYQQYVDRLKSKTTVRILLEPPREKVAVADSQSRGPAAAPIELIEFSDFQCPYCLRAHPTLNQVLNTYGDRIRFVYRHYPLPSHPNARPAAEASECASEQGKFWAYHDRLFADPGKLSDADLKRTAADLGLDSARFNSCVDSRKYQARVDADIKDGNDAGVSGTPAFFINGRMLSGAQPFEAFKQIIDEELEVKKP